jgi:hypothetical protein
MAEIPESRSKSFLFRELHPNILIGRSCSFSLEGTCRRVLLARGEKGVRKG